MLRPASGSLETTKLFEPFSLRNVRSDTQTDTLGGFYLFMAVSRMSAIYAEQAEKNYSFRKECGGGAQGALLHPPPLPSTLSFPTVMDPDMGGGGKKASALLTIKLYAEAFIVPAHGERIITTLGHPGDRQTRSEEEEGGGGGRKRRRRRRR